MDIELIGSERDLVVNRKNHQITFYNNSNKWEETSACGFSSDVPCILLFQANEFLDTLERVSREKKICLVYQFKLALKSIESLVWWRIQVSENCNF